MKADRDLKNVGTFEHEVETFSGARTVPSRLVRRDGPVLVTRPPPLAPTCCHG